MEPLHGWREGQHAPPPAAPARVRRPGLLVGTLVRDRRDLESVHANRVDGARHALASLLRRRLRVLQFPVEASGFPLSRLGSLQRLRVSLGHVGEENLEVARGPRLRGGRHRLARLLLRVELRLPETHLRLNRLCVGLRQRPLRAAAERHGTLLGGSLPLGRLVQRGPRDVQLALQLRHPGLRGATQLTHLPLEFRDCLFHLAGNALRLPRGPSRVFNLLLAHRDRRAERSLAILAILAHGLEPRGHLLAKLRALGPRDLRLSTRGGEPGGCGGSFAVH